MTISMERAMLEQDSEDTESTEFVEENNMSNVFRGVFARTSTARLIVWGGVLLLATLGIVAVHQWPVTTIRHGDNVKFPIESHSPVGLAEDSDTENSGTETSDTETSDTETSDTEDEDSEDEESEAEEIVEKKPCNGKCKAEHYKCVEKADGSYSQCLNCEGNYKYDCAAYDNDLRISAIIACKKPCDSNPPKPPCGLGSIFADYAKSRCQKQEDGSIGVVCEAPNPQHCGMRFTSMLYRGVGQYSVAMQASRGAGISSSLYLHKTWNDIKFEVLGINCGSNKTDIFTVFWAGDFNASAPFWERRPERKKYITVPFDACADWHTYTIAIDTKSISWLVDGKPYRAEAIEEYPDMVEAITEELFQPRLEVRGQDKATGHWPDMGYLIDSDEDFPLYTWFANLDEQPDE